MAVDCLPGPDASRKKEKAETPAGLRRELTACQERLAVEVAINAAITSLTRAIVAPATSDDDIYQLVLDHARELTGSAHGFVSSIEPKTGAHISHTLTRMRAEGCTVPAALYALPQAPHGFHGLWGYALNTREAFFTNDPAAHPATCGLPSGHISLQRFLAVPVIFAGTLLGQIALANSSRDYSESDLLAVQRLAELYAVVLQNRRREEALIKRELEYKMLVDTFPAVVARFDKETRCVFVNATVQRSAGYRPEDFAKVWDGQKHYVPGLANLRQVFDTGNPLDFESQFPDAAGNMRSYHVHLIPEIADNGKVETVLAISADITEAKRIEKEMARLDRMNLVGEMAASIGHEVRNPMTTVRGFLQFLGNKEENRHLNEHMRLMINELDRANSIISEFLSLAKNKATEPRLADLNAVIEAMQPLLQADALRTGHNLRLELGDITEVLLDEKDIRQLILNLVRNSVEATAEAGITTIETYADCDKVSLVVRDTGPGIPAEIYDKLGTPFLTTKEHGVGLGLSVCFRIAQRHNAEMRVHTSPRGTAVLIEFPVSRG